MVQIKNGVLSWLASELQPRQRFSKSRALNPDLSDRGSPVTTASALYDYVKQPEHRSKVLAISWVLSIVLTSVLSLLILLLFDRILHAPSIGLATTVFLWSSFLGASMLLFLPSKAITTVFGTLFGTTVEKVTSGISLIDKTNEFVVHLSQQIFEASAHMITLHLVQGLVWEFLIVLGLLCLPAFVLQ